MTGDAQCDEQMDVCLGSNPTQSVMHTTPPPHVYHASSTPMDTHIIYCLLTARKATVLCIETSSTAVILYDALFRNCP